MTGDKYLSQVVEVEMFRPGKLNLIYAPCGCGKTTFATEAIPTYASEFRNVLYLIDTVNGRSEVRKHPNIQYIDDMWLWTHNEPVFTYEEFKVVVITYAKFGIIKRKYPYFGTNFEYIICDELHNLIRFSHFHKDENHKFAKGSLEGIVADSRAKVIALTATPEAVYKEMRCPIATVPIDTTVLKQYETFNTTTYSNITYLLDTLPHNGRGIVFTPHITDMKRYEGILRGQGRKPISIWSINNTDHTMTEEQLTAREYLLQEEGIFPGYDTLLINSSSETGISIRQPIDYMVINSRNDTTRIQVRGRYRDDLAQLYVPALYGKEIPVVPSAYIGRKLYVEDKQSLCEILNLRSKNNSLYKWNTVSQRLSNCGYNITNGQDRSPHYKRYSIVTEE